MDANKNNTPFVAFMFLFLFFLLNKELQVFIKKSPVDSENLFSPSKVLWSLIHFKSKGPPVVEKEWT